MFPNTMFYNDGEYLVNAFFYKSHSIHIIYKGIEYLDIKYIVYE